SRRIRRPVGPSYRVSHQLPRPTKSDPSGENFASPRSAAENLATTFPPARSIRRVPPPPPTKARVAEAANAGPAKVQRCGAVLLTRSDRHTERPTESRYLPSGVKATWTWPSSCLVSRLPSGRPVVGSQSRTSGSESEVATSRPHGEAATDQTG